MPLSRSDDGTEADDALRRHHDGLRRYLRYLGARPDRIDDLAQEVFAKAFAAPFEWRSERETGAWLRTIARNTFVSSARRRDVFVATDRLDELVVAWETHCGDDDGDGLLIALRECLQQLGERHRQALAWRYGEQCPVPVVAQRLGVGAAGAESLLVRLRRALRRCIEGRRGA